MTKANILPYAFWAVASLAGSATACQTWVAQPPTRDRIVTESERGSVRVIKVDNSVLMLNHLGAVHDTLFGTTVDAASEHVAIPLSQVRSIGSKQVSAVRSVGLGAGITVGLLAVGGLIAGIALLGSHGQF